MSMNAASAASASTPPLASTVMAKDAATTDSGGNSAPKTVNSASTHKNNRSTGKNEPPADRTVLSALAGTAHEEPETFLPLTKAALLDRLSEPHRWPGHDVRVVRRLFRYLDYWRQQQYNMRLLGLLQAYEPFSPDTDLLQTRDFTPAEEAALQKRVIDGVDRILMSANFRRLPPEDLDRILSAASIYGLDFHVDLDAFEEARVYYRGLADDTHERRSLRRFWRKEEFQVPMFRRLCIVFKLKQFDVRVREVMAAKGWSEARAKRHVTRRRAALPKEISDGNIYLKLFRNIPYTDMEMVFPNTQVRFRMWDKVRLGATAGGGLGFGLFTSAGKIALLATNPLAAAGALAGVGAIAFRQAMAFMNQKQRYMVVMAQKLYFHAMADNRGVIVKIASRAAEEDIKEDWLLYSVLAKAPASRADIPAIDKAIERHLEVEFGIVVNFDVTDALRRLIADGLVVEHPDGRIEALDPSAGATHVDALWDRLLDNLPDPGHAEGIEIEGQLPGADTPQELHDNR